MCKILNPLFVPEIAFWTMLRMFMWAQDLFRGTANIYFSLIADCLCSPPALWSSAAALPLPQAGGCFKADSSSGWLTSVSAGTQPTEKKNSILELEEVIWKMTLNLACTVRCCRLENGHAWYALACAWVFVLMWFLVLYMCVTVHLLRRHFRPWQAWPVRSVWLSGWLMGAGAQGITCPWHSSCSPQTGPEHIMF